MSKNLVIVESPAKAKTISKFLGKDYDVRASMGHIRDLPKSNMGIDILNGFAPEYEISSDKKKVVSELKKLAKADAKVWIATDEDREGEAIGWHLCSALGLDCKTVDRIVFHEITKTAITKALETPRKIDENLVDAQQARRVLDRLVGYKLSPLLWKKIKTGLSAGRVQSVAVRLIVEREREIRAFDPKEFWKIKVDYNTPAFSAELKRMGGKDIYPKDKDSLLNNEEKAKKAVADLEKAEHKIASIESKDAKRNPAAPFTTSTLQQEASRKLGMSVKQTMMVAQKLYEGADIHVPHHEGGLITYMRTDSVNLSGQALAQASDLIKEKYGEKYHQVRKYKTKAKGAQEAHEAIRPTNLGLTPDMVKNYVKDNNFYRLYKLIWDRTIASQMASAEYLRTVVKIEAGEYELEARGQIVKFDGFLKVYQEGYDDDEEGNPEDKLLPEVKENQICDVKEIEPTQNFTKPPARYTEASLVKKLESEGIGRPSTYAPTIGTIMTRGYIEKNDSKQLVPTDIAEIVNDFLVDNFGKIVDYKFTANVEEDFDKVAEGKLKWAQMMENFYDGFEEEIKRIDENVSRADVAKERQLGIDPKSGKPVSVRFGAYGPFAQIGTKDDEEKPKYASLDAGMKLDEVTLEQALALFKFPRIVGQEDGEDVKINKGRFGPYVQIGKEYFSIRDKEMDLGQMTLEQALEVVASERERKAKSRINVWENEDIAVLLGPYGAYIKHAKKNYKIIDKEEKENAKDITLERAKEIIAAGPAKKAVKRKAPAKKKTAKKK